MRHRLAFAALLLAVAGCSTTSDLPRTAAERSGFDSTSTGPQVEQFTAEIARRSSRLVEMSFGTTGAGRPMRLSVLADPAVRTPEAARLRGRPVVLVMANIHAGEVEGKEAAQSLIRRLALGDLRPLLKQLTVLVVPNYNADGAATIGRDHRPGQFGPFTGVGTRATAAGFDLNRDYAKLETPEARALVALMTAWDPALVIDLHTTNGSHHGYALTYAPPLNPNVDPALLAYERSELLPAVRRQMRDSGFEIYDYGNFADEEGQPTPGWYTFSPAARYGTNYVGLRNRLAVLSEAYSYRSFAERVAATERFTELLLRRAARDRRKITALVADADRRAAAGLGDDLGVQFRFPMQPDSTDIRVGSVRIVMRFDSTDAHLEATDDVRLVRMADQTRFESASTRQLPLGYTLPAGRSDLAATLRRHGIRVDSLAAPMPYTVRTYRIMDQKQAPQAFQGHRLRGLTVDLNPPTSVALPAGTFVVPTAQPLARLIHALLEPDGGDAFATWNGFDKELARGVYPVLRLEP